MTKTHIAFSQQKMNQDHPAVFVQGQPGIGKSQAIYRIAKKLEKETGLKVFVTEWDCDNHII